jgi:GNAT superfamily N-acetyltransferase
MVTVDSPADNPPADPSSNAHRPRLTPVHQPLTGPPAAAPHGIASHHEPIRNNRLMADSGPPAEADPVITRLAEDAWPIWRAVRLAALADSPASFGSTLAEEQAYDGDRWRDIIRAGVAFVATTGATPVGMAGGIRRSRTGECGLGAMWVATSWRGSGLAARLVGEVVGWAQAGHNRRVSLWAPSDNARACRFYQRQGFVLSGAAKPFPGAPGRLIIEMFVTLCPPIPPARLLAQGRVVKPRARLPTRATSYGTVIVAPAGYPWR